MRLVHNSLHDEVAAQLRDRIFDGELLPGTFLDEVRLAEQMKISRTPLREALKVLTAEGLVRHEPRRGSFVNQATEQDLDEIFPVIALLEGRCAYEAARNASDVDLDALEALHDKLRRHAKARRINDYYEVNFAIHEAIITLANNRWLAQVIGDLRKIVKLSRLQQLHAPGRLEQSLSEHMAVYAALKAHADSVAGADDRTRAQIMADTLVERVTGQSKAAAVPIAVNVVMSEQTLLGDSNEAAEVDGYGPVPAHVARRLITDGFEADSDVATSIRRLYMRPTDGSLVSMDAKSRCFPKALAHFIKMRDRVCRVDYCGGAIEEIDHALPHRLGGATDAENGNGLCRAHNHAKEADGWTFTVHQSDGGHVIDIVTPFGRGHASTAATAVGFRFAHDSLVDARLRAALNAA